MWFHLFDTIYAGTVLSYGLVPGVVGFLVCFFVPSYARWIAALAMLLTTLGAVRGWAHYYPTYLVGCGVYVAASLAAVYARSRRRQTRFLAQHPYDIMAFAVGTAVLSLFYEAPLM